LHASCDLGARSEFPRMEPEYGFPPMARCNRQNNVFAYGARRGRPKLVVMLH
jgi:hypothetical protein